MTNKLNFSISEVINQAWALVKANFWFLITVYILFAIISGIPNGVYQHLVSTDSPFAILAYLIVFIINIFLGIGMIIIGLKVVDGQKPDYEDLFKGSKYMVRYFIVSILYGFIVGLGLIALVIPGIYLLFKYSFATALVIDKDYTVKEAFKVSAEMTSGIKLKMLGLALVQFLIIIVGVLALIVGLFAAIPTVYLASLVLYRQLERQYHALPQQQ